MDKEQSNLIGEGSPSIRPAPLGLSTKEYLEAARDLSVADLTDESGEFLIDRVRQYGHLIASYEISFNHNGARRYKVGLLNSAKLAELLAKVNGEILPPVVQEDSSDLAAKLINARRRTSKEKTSAMGN